MEKLATLCVTCEHCPEVVQDGDSIRIGEDTNVVVLKKEEWNILVDLIQSGRVGKL